MSRQLHPVQERLLDLLAKNIDDPLTVREIREVLNVSSTSVVAHHLAQLEKKGHLKRNPGNPRDYQVLHAGEKQVAYLNLYGLVSCRPRGSILDDPPIDRIPIGTRLLSFPSSDAFMVKARGDSMLPRISAGDLVIARKTKLAGSGRIVVCVNDGEALIKQVQKEGRGWILCSLNPAYPRFLASRDFRIIGEAKGIISRL